MSAQAIAQTQQLHALYVRLTGLQLPLNPNREMLWQSWCKICQEVGVTSDNGLMILVRHLQSEIRAGRRNPGALKLHNLIGQFDLSQEDLAQAIAVSRRPTMAPGLKQVLKATGRSVEPPTSEARKASEILESKGFKDLVAFKDELKAKRPGASSDSGA